MTHSFHTRRSPDRAVRGRNRRNRQHPPAQGPARTADPPRQRVLSAAAYPQRQADPDQVGPGAVRPRASGHAPGTHFPFQAARHRQPRTPARRLSPFSSSPSMRPNLLSFALCLALPGMALAHGESSAAEAAPAAAAATEFARVVVTATRTERAISDVPNTVDVIHRARLDDILARAPKDLFHLRRPAVTDKW